MLLRLRDEQGQIISPATFIPAAERYGIMPTVDRWVIARTLATLAQHPAALQLLAHLWRVKAGHSAIEKFKSYVAVTAHNACNEYLRQAHPVFRSLGDQIQYLFEKHPGLALWKSSDGRDVAGRSHWRLQDPEPVGDSGPEMLERFAANHVDRPSPPVRGSRLVGLVESILDVVQRPLRLADMAALIADWVGASRTFAAEEPGGTDPAPTVEQIAIWRAELRQTWEALLQLDLAHRRAILLNLRYGADLTTLIMNEVATPAQIADALGIRTAELASLLQRLPLENDEIAAGFQFSHGQQVNNSRQWGRKILKKMRDSSWK